MLLFKWESGEVMVESILMMYDIMHSCTVISELYAQILRSCDHSKSLIYELIYERKRLRPHAVTHVLMGVALTVDRSTTLDVLGTELDHER